jgi:uncharacterized protein (TIRG00374 family)
VTRRIGWAVGAIALALLLIGDRHDIPAVWHQLRSSDWRWVAVGITVMLLGFVNLGWMHAAARRAVGIPTPTAPLVPVAMSANALNLVVKSGGMAGLGAFTSDGRKRGLARGPVIAAYVLVVTVADVAFTLMLLVALVTIIVDGRFSLIDGIAVALFTVYLVIRGSLLAVAWRSRAAVRRLMSWPSRMLARSRRRPAPVPDNEAADELFDSLGMIRADPRRMVPTTAHACIVDLVGILELWAVCHAVGTGTGLYVAFVAYLVSVLFAIVSVLPAGLGFVELSLSAILVSFGSSVTTAAAAVVLYRLFELWLPLASGGLATLWLRRSRE